MVGGDLYLRGGGDPSFDAKATGLLADLVIERTGLTEVSGRVIGDESAFDGLRGPPSEGFRTSSYVGPLSALTFNRGFTGDSLGSAVHERVPEGGPAARVPTIR